MDDGEAAAFELLDADLDREPEGTGLGRQRLAENRSHGLAGRIKLLPVDLPDTVEEGALLAPPGEHESAVGERLEIDRIRVHAAARANRLGVGRLTVRV